MLKSQHFTIYSLPSAPITLVLDGNFQLLLPKRLSPSFTPGCSDGGTFSRWPSMYCTVEFSKQYAIFDSLPTQISHGTEKQTGFRLNYLFVVWKCPFCGDTCLGRTHFGVCSYLRNNGEGRSAVTENNLLVFVFVEVSHYRGAHTIPAYNYPLSSMCDGKTWQNFSRKRKTDRRVVERFKHSSRSSQKILIGIFSRTKSIGRVSRTFYKRLG